MDERTSFSPIQAQPLDYFELFYKGRILKLTASDLPFSIGRDEDDCDLAVDDQGVSRLHCSLIIQNDQFGLQDSSTNGTAVQTGRAGSITLKEGFYPLTGHGCIQLGKTLSPSDPNLIHYKVVFKD